MTEIKEYSVQKFLDELASAAPTPGGGGAAAMMGAQAAGLISMVCNLTIGKPKYIEVEVDMQAVLTRAEELRAAFVDMIKADAQVFDKVMEAYGLPKETDADKTARSAAIQEALKIATEVPLACAKACVETLRLSMIAAEKGNVNVISDAGVAAMAGFAALKSAALNVYVNTGSLKDRGYAEACLVELEEMLSGAEGVADSIYQLVKSKL